MKKMSTKKRDTMSSNYNNDREVNLLTKEQNSSCLNYVTFPFVVSNH